MIIYLSGPMSNLPAKNHPEFNRVAKLLRDQKHQVLNPAENDGGSTDKKWEYYMRLDIDSLLIADTVVLLENWEFSRGAKLEIAIAQTIGLKIYRLNEFLRSRNPKPFEPQVNVLVT